MTEEKKPFTVSDRRHFTAEGEARQQVADEPATPAPPKAEPQKATASAGAAGAGERSPAQNASEGLLRDSPSESHARASLPHSDDTPERADDTPPMDFIGLLVSLATQAGYLMSPEPGSGALPDFAGARAIIGLLDILREKTEGRRTPDEDRVLDSLLYELRMAFVARNRAEKA